ncbi:MAG TPA: GAF domain-containing protein [Vicinamibacteria bacterium]|nr:GAF domain-containing protein [Vicinamibacteria bacterium]
MTVTRQDDKPWKTDLARKAAERREQVAKELEGTIRTAPSFEEALRQALELMKRRFARYSSVTAYVADGEELAVHLALERPQGPERVGSTGGPLAEAAEGTHPTVVHDLAASPVWATVGLSSGSAMVAPVRTEAGLWAIVEVWSDFREAFSPQDAKVLDRVAQALARKTPAA